VVATNSYRVSLSILFFLFSNSQPRTGTTYLHRLLSLDPSSRAPLTWELFDPTRRIHDDLVHDEAKRIKFCQKNIDFLISLTPQVNLVHEMGADLPEECLMALVGVSFERVHSVGGALPDSHTTSALTFPLYLFPRDLCSCQGLDAPLLFDTFHLFLENPDTAYTWDCTGAYLNYAKVLQLLQYHASLTGEDQTSLRHWILKCPIHLGLLRYLSAAFPGPEAKLIWTHRDVNDAIPSLARLIRVGMVSIV